MQETDFIAQNKNKWKDFEDELYLDNKDPEKLLDLFMQTTDDLSFSKTRYPNRSVRFYLNGVARQVHGQLYHHRKSKKNAFMRFWQYDLPRALFIGRKPLAFAFAIMLLGLIVGVASSVYYQGFPAIILSEGYIELTEEMIAKGDPMGIYGMDKDPFHMFLAIAWNNIQYAFGAYAFGIVFGIGTVYALLSTGIMVGAFAYFFVAKGLFKQFFLAVMLHGTLELGMITFAGAAGFMLSNAVLFPGTYTRLESIILAARSSIKIMLAVALFLLYAALIEGFLTRHTDASDAARLGLISLSAAILLGYFVWYPMYLNRNGAFRDQPVDRAAPIPEPTIFLDTVKSAGQMLSETFFLLFKHIKLWFRLSWMWSALAVVVACVFMRGDLSLLPFTTGRALFIDVVWPWAKYRPFYAIESSWQLTIAILVVLAAALWSIMRIVPRMFDTDNPPDGGLFFGSCLSVSLLWMTALQVPEGFRELLMFVLFPLGTLALVICRLENVSVLTAFARALRLAYHQLGAYAVVCSAMVIVHWFLLLFFESVLFQYVMQFILMNIPVSLNGVEQVPYIVVLFGYGGALLFVAVLMSVGSVIYYYSALEVSSARHLLMRIRHLGERRKSYGMDRENDV